MTVVYPNSTDNINLRKDGSVRLFCKQTGDGGIPMFMVHGDEANTLIPKYLPDSIPFYAFYHMGTDGRKIPFMTIEEMASVYLREIREIQPLGPYILGGYSIGGLIAYQMARMLIDDGEEVRNLILLDSKSPSLHGEREYHNRQFRWNESKLVKFTRKAYKKIVIGACTLFRVPVPKSQMPFFLMERYRRARRLYHPENYPGDLTLVRSKKDNFKDPQLGWKNHIDGKIKVYEIDTDHHHITIEPDVIKVASVFTEIYTR